MGPVRILNSFAANVTFWLALLWWFVWPSFLWNCVYSWIRGDLVTFNQLFFVNIWTDEKLLESYFAYKLFGVEHKKAALSISGIFNLWMFFAFNLKKWHESHFVENTHEFKPNRMSRAAEFIIQTLIKWCINVNFSRENRISLKSVIFAIRIRDPATTVCWWGEHFMVNLSIAPFSVNSICVWVWIFQKAHFPETWSTYAGHIEMGKKAVSQSKTKPINVYLFTSSLTLNLRRCSFCACQNKNLFHIYGILLTTVHKTVLSFVRMRRLFRKYWQMWLFVDFGVLIKTAKTKTYNTFITNVIDIHANANANHRSKTWALLFDKHCKVLPGQTLKVKIMEVIINNRVRVQWTTKVRAFPKTTPKKTAR